LVHRHHDSCVEVLLFVDPIVDLDSERPSWLERRGVQHIGESDRNSGCVPHTSLDAQITELHITAVRNGQQAPRNRSPINNKALESLHSIIEFSGEVDFDDAGGGDFICRLQVKSVGGSGVDQKRAWGDGDRSEGDFGGFYRETGCQLVDEGGVV